MQQRAPDVRSAQAELPVDFLGACRSSCAVSVSVQAVHQAQQQAAARGLWQKCGQQEEVRLGVFLMDILFLLKLNGKK